MIKTSVMTVRYTINSGPFGNGNLTVDLKPGRQGRAAFAAPHGAYQTASSVPRQPRRLVPGARRPGRAGAASRRDPLARTAGTCSTTRSRRSSATAASASTSARPHQGAYQDGYLFGYGDDYARALQDFRDLTGAAPLLPRRAFGIWFSRYQGYSENDYKQLLGQFRSHRVPLDVLVVDTDYKSPHDWNGWQWTPNYFPQPGRFVKWAHGQGLELVLNVHPSIATDDPSYLGRERHRRRPPRRERALQALRPRPADRLRRLGLGEAEPRRLLLRPPRALRGGRDRRLVARLVLRREQGRRAPG